MRYRERANKLANEVASMAQGELRGFPLEGAVSKIEQALEQARRDGLEHALDRVRYTRYSIIIHNDDLTRGYIRACQHIEDKIRNLLDVEC